MTCISRNSLPPPGDPETFYRSTSFLLLKLIKSLEEIHRLRTNVTTSSFVLSEYLLHVGGWDRWQPLGQCLSSKKKHPVQLRTPTTAGISLLQNVLAVALKWQIWGVAVSAQVLPSNQHWLWQSYLLPLFFLLWVILSAIRSSCPTCPVKSWSSAYPRDLQLVLRCWWPRATRPLESCSLTQVQHAPGHTAQLPAELQEAAAVASWWLMGHHGHMGQMLLGRKMPACRA